MSHIGEKVKQLRDLKKLTNSEFARVLDMTENNLFSLYRREDTTTEIVKKIMVKMGVSSSYFFDDKAYINISQQGQVNTLGENSVNYTVAKGGENDAVEVALLRLQLESANKEIDYLKQIIEMLKAK